MDLITAIQIEMDVFDKFPQIIREFLRNANENHSTSYVWKLWQKYDDATLVVEHLKSIDME